VSKRPAEGDALSATPPSLVGKPKDEMGIEKTRGIGSGAGNRFRRPARLAMAVHFRARMRRRGRQGGKTDVGDAPFGGEKRRHPVGYFMNRAGNTVLGLIRRTGRSCQTRPAQARQVVYIGSRP
jgi:hypothetical protein